MICPICSYLYDEYGDEMYTKVEGTCGGFYYITELLRESNGSSYRVLGCPSCKQLFIDD